MISLRSHQALSVDMIRQAIRGGYRAPTLVASTGFGKTRVSAFIASASASKGKSVLFMAPRRNLVLQTWKAFRDLGVDAGMIMADIETKHDLPVQIASIDTVMARIDKPGAFGTAACENASVIIFDESHLYASEKRAKFVNDLRSGVYGKNKIIMHLTATPCTSSGGGLGAISDKLLVPITMIDLIDGGHLLRPRYYSAEAPDLSSVRIHDNEYNTSDLGKVYDGKIMGSVVDSFMRIAGDKTGVIFCATRANAADVCDKLNAAGVVAKYADAKTPDTERKEIFRQIESGEVQVIVNCLIINIGTDLPRLQVASFAMATKSIGRWMQGVGRVLRPYPGQDDAIVIDHGGMCLNPAMGPVEYINDWSLDVTGKVQDRVEARKKEAKERKDIKCPNPKCAIVFKSAHCCPSCGEKMKSKVKGEAIEYHDVELSEVVDGKPKKSQYTQAQKTDYYAQLLGYARQHGKKPGSAYFRYIEIFGVGPAGKKPEPIPPGPEVLGMIRHLQIKKSRSKVAA